MLENYSDKIQSLLKKNKVNIGDRIKIISDNVFEGVLIPRKEIGDRDSLVIKQDSGYNIGVKVDAKTKIEKITSIKAEVKREVRKIKFDPSKPTISILHTGGTIASKVDYKTGGVATNFLPEDIVGMFPELENIANIKSRLVRNMWSGDMRFAHHQLIAKEVVKETPKK